MKRIQCILIVIVALSLFGCSGGEAKIGTYKADPAANQPSPTGQPNSVNEAVQGNPNMPQAAKDAILGKGK